MIAPQAPIRAAIACALLMGFCMPSLAADMSPGLWEIAVESRAAAQPGFTPEPFRLKQCLGAQDVKDPGALLGGYANPGASGCTYTDRSYSGSTFRFSMQCGGAFAIQARGEMTYSADAMDGSIEATANVGGTPAVLTNKVSARRLGGC